MKTAIVMGAGWAGLTAAHDLSQAGLEVTVIEKGPAVGGRARSFTDSSSGQVLDNGQHILLTSYVETLSLLRDCNISPKLYVPDTLSLVFRGSQNRAIHFDCPNIAAPLAMVWGLIGMKGVSLPQKLLALLGPIFGAPFSFGRDRSVESLLDIWGQSETLRHIFWRPLVTGTLNTPTHEASARLFLQVLWQGFLKHPFSSRYAFPAAGLSEIFPDPIRKVLEKRGVRILTRCPIKKIAWEGPNIKSLITRDKTFEADLYVSTLPWHILTPLLESQKAGHDWSQSFSKLLPSAIVTVYLNYDQQVLNEPYAGLLDQPFDWAFDRGPIFGLESGPVALVKSAADELVSKKVSDIRKSALAVMEAVFPRSRGLKPTNISVFKEPHATFRAQPGVHHLRPKATGPIENLFLGGAWTQTGLPSTLEGAVRSGRMAARAALQQLHRKA